MDTLIKCRENLTTSVKKNVPNVLPDKLAVDLDGLLHGDTSLVVMFDKFPPTYPSAYNCAFLVFPLMGDENRLIAEETMSFSGLCFLCIKSLSKKWNLSSMKPLKPTRNFPNALGLLLLIATATAIT